MSNSGIPGYTIRADQNPDLALRINGEPIYLWPLTEEVRRVEETGGTITFTIEIPISFSFTE